MIADCHRDGKTLLMMRFDGKPPMMKGILILVRIYTSARVYRPRNCLLTKYIVLTKLYASLLILSCVRMFSGVPRFMIRAFAA